jgi:ectoine hydroxylase-related dioxygenase (phytanoyl-CoA dioxygenase family)
MTSPENERVLTQEQIDQFLDQGVLVVENILSQSKLNEANEGLSRTLAEYGIDTQHLDVTGHALERLSSTNGSGGVLDLFYPEWKMQVASNSRLFHATCELWEAAYCHHGESRDELDDSHIFKWHPHGPFNCKRGYMYIDRIGYRIPTAMAEQLGASTGKKSKKAKPIQRSLTPHLDCCPDNLFSQKASKWRPIQCFVSLTDNLEPNTGGFEAALGFHKTFHKWIRPRSAVKNVSFPAPCIGEYTHIRPKEDRDVMALIQHIPVRAGSAVFWDNRIPHANAYQNDQSEVRAVVYCSFLPDIKLNREYVRRQLYNYQRRIPPTDQWINTTERVVESCRMYREEEHEQDVESAAAAASASLRRKLLGLDPW